MMDISAVVAVGFQDGSVGRMQIFEREQLLTFPAIPTPSAVWPSDEDIQTQIDMNAETWASLGLKTVSWHRCELSDFPVENHDFRDAWTVVVEKIAIDMDKAKEITRDRLRAERAPVLAEKDIDALKALEAGDTKALADVSAEKQRLRDITKLPAIDAAQTVDDLRAITLE